MTSKYLTEIIQKDVLLNEDNDKFIRKNTELSSGVYKLVQYNKPNLNIEDYSSYGLIRSAIFNLNNNHMICYSPPKSLSFKQFHDTLTTNVIVEEFVEGTMINLFFDNDEWHISTRGSFGGKCKFYQGEEEVLSFYEMFNNVCKQVNFSFDLLPTNYSYSFVMQNIKNRIVKPIKEDRLYFISAYEIINDSDKVMVNNLISNKEKLDEIKRLMSENTTIRFPKVYDEFSKDEIKKVDTYYDLYASKNTKYDIMGVVFKNSETGEFMKLRNPNHKEVHDLKGNHCKIQYIYLDVRKTKTVDKYLRYYPHDRTIFTFFRQNLHLYTKKLFDNYVSCYMKKSKPLKEWPFEFRIHMFNIHQKYLTELKDQNKYVTMPVVIQYFNDLHPSQQMYVLNYNLRKKNIETAAVQVEEKDV
jgi:hypothetical protein